MKYSQFLKNIFYMSKKGVSVYSINDPCLCNRVQISNSKACLNEVIIISLQEQSSRNPLTGPDLERGGGGGGIQACGPPRRPASVLFCFIRVLLFFRF